MLLAVNNALQTVKEKLPTQMRSQAPVWQSFRMHPDGSDRYAETSQFEVRPAVLSFHCGANSRPNADTQSDSLSTGCGAIAQHIYGQMLAWWSFQLNCHWLAGLGNICKSAREVYSSTVDHRGSRTKSFFWPALFYNCSHARHAEYLQRNLFVIAGSDFCNK